MSYKTLQILSLLSFLRRLNILPTMVTFHLPSVNTVCSCGQWLVRLQYMWGYTRSNTSFPRPGRSENVWRFKCMWLYTYFSFSSRIAFYFKVCSQWLFFFLLNLHPNNPGRLLVSVPEWDSFLAVWIKTQSHCLGNTVLKQVHLFSISCLNRAVENWPWNVK